jgi:hypothetical protein
MKIDIDLKNFERQTIQAYLSLIGQSYLGKQKFAQKQFFFF